MITCSKKEIMHAKFHAEVPESKIFGNRNKLNIGLSEDKHLKPHSRKKKGKFKVASNIANTSLVSRIQRHCRNKSHVYEIKINNTTDKSAKICESVKTSAVKANLLVSKMSLDEMLDTSSAIDWYMKTRKIPHMNTVSRPSKFYLGIFTQLYRKPSTRENAVNMYNVLNAKIVAKNKNMYR